MYYFVACYFVLVSQTCQINCNKQTRSAGDVAFAAAAVFLLSSDDEDNDVEEDSRMMRTENLRNRLRRMKRRRSIGRFAT